MKLTPDQLHRLIDEVAALAEVDDGCMSILLRFACERAECSDWWNSRGRQAYWGGLGRYVDDGHGNASGDGCSAASAGLSAVLILLSEGG